MCGLFLRVALWVRTSLLRAATPLVKIMLACWAPLHHCQKASGRLLVGQPHQVRMRPKACKNSNDLVHSVDTV